MEKTTAQTQYGIQDVYEDHDLKVIMNRRMLRRFLTMIFEVVNRTEKKKFSFKLEKLEELLETVIDKELTAFANEFSRYNKKFKTDIFDDLKKARQGNDRSLRHLLQWDRAWLKIEWVTDRIMAAQDAYDFQSIKAFGEAIEMKPGCLTKPKHTELIEQLKPFCDATGFGDREIKSVRGMHDFLNEKGILKDEMVDFDYFVKYLRRHNVIL